MELHNSPISTKIQNNTNFSPSLNVPKENSNKLVSRASLTNHKVDEENQNLKLQKIATKKALKIEKKNIKKERRTNKKITRKHPEFELTYDMMLGIRTCVSMVEASQCTKLDYKLFSDYKKLNFPKKGSTSTPAHSMNSFRFKDYCPAIFRRIRNLFHVDPTEYLISLCSDFPYLEFVSNSNSGEFFFYSFDRRFMIKTQSKRECSFLRKILKFYYQHVEENPNTLLTQFLGMHKVKRKNHSSVHFIIMSSVFRSNIFIHEVYDLKGSTQGRFAKKAEKNQEVPILKDNDFVERGVRINLGSPLRHDFFNQLRLDCDFLTKMKIMDYSLILGIHYLGETPLDLSIHDTVEEKIPLYKRQSVFAIKKNREVTSPYQKRFKVKAILENQLSSKDSLLKNDTNNLFTYNNGGVKSNDGLKIYFLGVIDILQQFNTVKKIENKIKSLKYKKNAISAIKPNSYAQRLIDFLEKHVD